MLVRCVVAWAVHGFLFEKSEKFCPSPCQNGKKPRRICIQTVSTDKENQRQWRCHQLHVPAMRNLKEIVCPPRTSQNINTVSEPCENLET